METAEHPVNLHLQQHNVSPTLTTRDAWRVCTIVYLKPTAVAKSD